MTQFYELPPAGLNPPYGPGDYVGCCPAVCADFITAYTSEKVTDLSALGKSMGQRHRNVDPSCRHGIPPTAFCSYCIFLELYARGLPVAYQSLTWQAIVQLVTAGKWVAMSGLYSHIGYVAPSTYSATVPARGRSDTFTGAHELVLTGVQSSRFRAYDPDFGNYRGEPPYSLLDPAQVESFWASLDYAVTYTTKAPGGAAPSHKATVKTPNTHLYNPVTGVWVYSLKVGTVLTVGGHATMQGGKSCVPVRGPDPYTAHYVPVANVRILP